MERPMEIRWRDPMERPITSSPSAVAPSTNSLISHERSEALRWSQRYSPHGWLPQSQPSRPQEPSGCGVPDVGTSGVCSWS